MTPTTLAKSLADKPFDVIRKRLIAAHPADWLALIGVTDTGTVPFEVVDADLATLVPQADRVLLKGGTVPELFNLECETGHHGSKLADRLLLYSVTLTQKYSLPVRSAVFLLRKEADSPALTGTLERRFADETVYLRYNYSVVRVWQLPVEQLLTGGIATLPLAPIADVSESELPRVISRMRERIEAEPKEEQQELWASTYFLMGAKYPGSLTNQLLKGIGTMFESSTYNEAVEKGRAQGVAQGVAQGELSGRLQQGRESLLMLEARLGVPSQGIKERIRSIPTTEDLNRCLRQGMIAQSWEELFPTR